MNEDKTIKMILYNLQVCNCSSSRVSEIIRSMKKQGPVS